PDFLMTLRRFLDSRTVFVAFNYLFLTVLGLLCLFPLLHILALSFSSSAAASAGQVKLWPVGFTTSAYEYALSNEQFLRSLLTSFERVAVGVTVNMVLTVLVAYPLSKQFRGRAVYVWFFVITMLFSGGLIPKYMVVQETGLLDTIWALVLPNAVPVFNMILLLNFFRGIPKEFEEAAFVDGAGHWRVLWTVYLPLSKPALATIALFTVVFHWNSWFDGIIYMNSPENYPLQSYLQTIVVESDLSVRSPEEQALLREVSDRTFKAAQIFLAALPVLAVYPFLQRYFVKGTTLGGIKG
ncbi:MAG TPA: carbohydrate ABC transporter permease, partial [Candidatus Limnocylindrales bacterium]